MRTIVATKINFLKKLAPALISLIVVTILGLQACVSFLPWRHSLFPSTFRRILSPPTLWPFIDYPMYAAPHYQGDAIARVFLFGVLEDSTVVRIIAEDLGLGYWHFRKHFINGLIRDDYNGVKMFVNLYQNMTNRRLVSLRLEDHPLILAGDGLRSAQPQILKHLHLESARKVK